MFRRRVALLLVVVALGCSGLPVSRRSPFHPSDADLAVTRIAHDAVVLDQGRVVHRSDAKELLEQPELVRRLLSVGA